LHEEPARTKPLESPSKWQRTDRDESIVTRNYGEQSDGGE
jgi:hypothetical protein